jgi:hypothetical protein
MNIEWIIITFLIGIIVGIIIGVSLARPVITH